VWSDRIASTRLLAVMILLGSVLGAACGKSNEASACQVVTAAMLSTAVGNAVRPGRADVAEPGGPADATVCNYRSAVSDLSATVFAARDGAANFYAQQRRAADTNGSEPRDIDGPGFQAFGFMGNGNGGLTTQTFFLLKHGQYVNVILFGASAGAAQRLAVSTAGSIR
jgi:hypothetical protein